MNEPNNDDSIDQLHTTVDVLSLRLRAREDLAISLQVYGGETCYLIEDPLSSRFFRVGVSEYTLLSLLDGDCTIADAMGQTALLTGQEAMSEADTIAFCKWLVDSELATTVQSATGSRLAETVATTRRQRWLARLSPLHQKLPLSRPDELAEHFRPLAKWLFSPLGASVWVAVLFLGACSLWLSWDQFVQTTPRVLSPRNWLYLVGAWLTLKMVHESAHALACKRYGGEVREGGMLLILLAPLPYVDVTSAWRFDSKWKRITVSAAGMAAELLVAALAAWVWSRTDSASIQQTAQNIIITATVMTLAFNANPLMRFDGYYILADLIEMPNLATHGAQWARHNTRRIFLGGPPLRPSWPERQTRVIAAYGIAAMIWRVIVCVSLILLAESMFFGAGIVLALLAATTWLVLPLTAFIQEIRQQPETSKRKRAVLVLGTAGLATACLWMMFPFYSRVSAPVVVDYWPLTEVRSRVEGFVSKVSAQEGQLVAKNDLLVQLNNPELEIEAKRLEIEIAKARQRARDFRARDEITSLQVEDRNREALEQRLRKVQQELGALAVRAQHAGVVVDLPVRWKTGAFVAPGAPLVGLGDTRKKRLHIVVPQQKLAAFRSQVNRSIHAHLWGHGGSDAQLLEVRPRASTELQHPALASVAGGPLAVRAHQSDSPGRPSQQWELTKPHFLAVGLGKVIQSARPGQTGFVSFWHFEGSLGQVLLYRFNSWAENRRNQARQAWSR